jgi:general secretion pathway protein B
MSYILDALKKSEKERRRGNVPDLLITHDFTAKEKKKRIIWPYLIVVALLLNAGLLTWWVNPWEIKKSHSVSKSVADKSLTSERSVVSASEQSKTEITVNTFDNKKTTAGAEPGFKDTENKPDNTTRLSLPDKNKPAESDIKSSNKTYLAYKKSPEIETEKVQNAKPDDIIEPPIKNKIYNLDELPLSVKQKLPPLKITVSLYSDDPASRMAKINDQLLREGQYLAAGLKLEEITNEGVIFTYQNYRFRIGMK